MNIDNVLRILTKSPRATRAAPSQRRWERGAERATVITDQEQLRELEGEWSQLAEARANPFVSPLWFWTWLETCGKDDRPFVPVLHDRQGRLVGLMPFVRSGGKRFARLGFAGAAFGDYFHPVAHEGEAERRTSAAAMRALQERRGDWSVLVADYIDESAPWVAELATPGRDGVSLVPYHDHSSVYRFADVGGLTWDDYLATRSRNFREQLRRKQRSLAKSHAVTYRRADEATLTQDMETLFELHTRRWAGRKSEVFRTDRARAFHLGVARAALARHWLRLWVLEVDDKPIAAWYGWRLGDRYLYYQAGFDPAWGEYSPGVLLLAHTVRDAIEEGAQTYDMLLGDETYKTRFADEQRTARTFVVTRRRHPARAVVATDILVRRAVRRLPGDGARQVRKAIAPILRRWPIITAP
jgi:CelD/BcsL family acetyltransferase involved in cellulose biosynthesis